MYNIRTLVNGRYKFKQFCPQNRKSHLLLKDQKPETAKFYALFRYYQQFSFCENKALKSITHTKQVIHFKTNSYSMRHFQMLLWYIFCLYYSKAWTLTVLWVSSITDKIAFSISFFRKLWISASGMGSRGSNVFRALNTSSFCESCGRSTPFEPRSKCLK